MKSYSFRTPRYIVESPRQLKVNRTFNESSLMLPNGRKVHQVKRDEPDLNAYCQKHFSASSSEVLEARKAELVAWFKEAVEKAAPLMTFNNGGIPMAGALKAFEKDLKSIAEEGSADAKMQLGLLYCSSGQYFGHREEEGESWLLKAFKQNHSDAPSELGVYYIRHGNYPEALKYLRKGDKRGCPLSRFQLAELYLYGVEGAPKSFAKAFSLYKRASKGGYPLATAKMVALHLEAGLVNELPATPVELLDEAVKDGCKEAMFLLAELYEYGDQTPKNLFSALDLYYMAASLGSPDSQLKMGHIMKAGNRKGFPVEPDIEEALKWYTLAAQVIKNPEARGKALFCLGYHHASVGEHHLAIEYYKKAAELGSPEGEMALSQTLAAFAFMSCSDERGA